MERDHIGLIASDMDYTLLDENSQLPDGFAGLVRALEEEGIYFAAASGRPLYTLEAMFPTLRDHIALIGDNGGAIRWRGRDIYQSRMPGADYREMAAATREAGDIGVLCGMESAYVERQYERYARVLAQFYTRVTYVDDLTALDIPADKYTVYLPRGDAQAAYDKRYGKWYAGRFSVAVAGANWVDIMNRGVDKGAALRALGRSLGLQNANLMAFRPTGTRGSCRSCARSWTRAAGWPLPTLPRPTEIFTRFLQQESPCFSPIRERQGLWYVI